MRLEEKGIVRGLKNRILQHIARSAPGSEFRVLLHRLRGVRIGKGSWIGYDVVLETARPELISIGDGVSISMRATVIAHFKESTGVRIEQNAFIGPGAIILPGVVVGEGAVVTAGSVVTSSVSPMTVVQGNPARPVARCGVPLDDKVSFVGFSARLKPINSSARTSNEPSEKDAVEAR
ncbi:MAG: DapH/DapD/GlmU-related protein [Puia sp.]|nr:DapH/DapD/GlmU-related protein [Puia sp.]